MLSRESRVSLPDEAKQYIANMTDSPVASPRVDAFVAKFRAASRGSHPQVQIPDKGGGLVRPGAIGEEDSPGGTKGFLDMRGGNEDEDEGEGEGTSPHSRHSPRASYSRFPSSPQGTYQEKRQEEQVKELRSS